MSSGKNSESLIEPCGVENLRHKNTIEYSSSFCHCEHMRSNPVTIRISLGGTFRIYRTEARKSLFCVFFILCTVHIPLASSTQKTSEKLSPSQDGSQTAEITEGSSSSTSVIAMVSHRPSLIRATTKMPGRSLTPSARSMS